MELLKFLMILLCFLTQVVLSSCKGDDSPSTEDLCKKFAAFRRKEGYLSSGDVREYCKLGCNTLPKYSCPSEEPGISLDFNVLERLEKLFSASESLSDDWMTEVFDADSLFEITWFFAPWLYGLLYTVVSMQGQSEQQRRGPSILVNGIVLGSYFVFFRNMSKWPMLFNMLLCLQSSFATLNHHIFNDVTAVVLMVMSLAFSTLVIRDLIGQLLLGGLLLLGFVVLLYRKITSSRREDLFSILALLLTFKMCADYCQLIFDKLMIENPATLFIRHCIYAMVPWEGKYVAFLNNMNYSSAQVATLFIRSDDSPDYLYVFFISLIAYALLFLGVRCGLGMVMLRKMNVDLGSDAIWTGFYSYSIDVVNPFKIVFVAIAKKDQRMLWYAIIMCTFNIGDFFTAREFFFMRVFLMLLDFFVIESGLLGAHRFLDVDINLGGLVFEKPGAFPYCFIDDLMDVKRHCHKIIMSSVSSEGFPLTTASGVGLVRATQNGSRLFSVRHVLDDRDRVRTEDSAIDEEIKYLNIHGSSSDPPVSMALSGHRLNGSTIRDISESELASIKYLFMVSPSGAICPILDHSILNGDIRASVNLRQGDSGSPVCAILTSGICVLAGVVSRGDLREGSPNLISAIRAPERLNGSPGIIGPYHDLDAHRINDSSYETAVELGYECRRLAAEFSKEYPELFPNLDFHRQERDPLPWDPGPNGDVDGERQRKRKRVKNWKKNRRAQKEGYLAVLRTMNLDTPSFEAMNRFADGGPIVKFNILRKRSGIPNRFGIAG